MPEAEAEVVVNVIPQILAFGAIGLAFLMAFLAFRLVREVARQDKPPAQTIQLTRFYMVTTLVLLVVGCLLQIYIQNAPVDVNLLITPDLKQEIHPRVLVDLEDIQIEQQKAFLRLGSGMQINIQLDPVVSYIRTLESVGTATLQAKASQSNDLIGPEDEI